MMMEAERPKPRPRRRVAASALVDEDVQQALESLPVADHDLIDLQTVQEIVEHPGEEQVSTSSDTVMEDVEEAPSPVQVSTIVEETISIPLALPSAAVVEMPLSSLLPSMPQIIAPSRIAVDLYPSLPMELPPSVKVNAISAFCERNEHGLLTEQQLCRFYQNEALEALEDFVDDFIKTEESGMGGFLRGLLLRYKTVCEQLERKMFEMADVEKECANCQTQVWAVNTATVTQQGRCGCDKSASGSASFQSAELRPEALTRLARCLERSRHCTLDGVLCLQVAVRSIALQLQWMVVDEATRFLLDHRLTANCPASIVFCGGDLKSRVRLRSMLSDLFACLRVPQLPQQFLASVQMWIVELGAVLLRAATPRDQELLLCHILRCPGSLQWAIALMQPFADTQQVRAHVDHMVTMIAMLLAPIRARDDFLRSITQYLTQEKEWTLLSENDDEEEASAIAVNESDLIALLNQFSTEILYANTLQHFLSDNRIANVTTQILSLFAFQLTLTKILNDGLSTYGRAVYRQFCKQIGYTLRQSMRNLSEFWKSTSILLPTSERASLQAEFDRILLYVVNCLIGAKKLGVWQCLADLPYAVASELCRRRCEFALLSSTALSIFDLYELTINDLHREIASLTLRDRVVQVGNVDATYLISALAAIHSHCDADCDHFLAQLITTCFIDESSRDQLRKAGAEAIAVLIDRRPQLLSPLLQLIDRNVDSLDQYAVDILNTANMNRCRVSVDDVGCVCGKWLVQRTPEHPASRIARRVLSSLNWSGPAGDFRLPSPVHAACAEALMRAHRAQCQTRNGLLAKSVSKMTKLASRVPDREQQFDAFCWELLLRLKLESVKVDVGSLSSDLVGLYVDVIQRSLSSSGVGALSQLLAAGCFAAAVKILFHLVDAFPSDIAVMLKNASFVESVRLVIHADQSSYAMQWLAGADQFPGPVLKLLNSAINYHLSTLSDVTGRNNAVVSAWVKVCCSAGAWNADQCVLYLLEGICRFAFTRDPALLAGLPDLLHGIYQSMLVQAKETSRGGVWSWLAGDSSIPPPLIAKEQLNEFPWCGYVALLAEESAFPSFKEALLTTLVSKPNKTLEQAIKKASSKCGIALPVDRLIVSRWLSLCNAVAPRHPVFVLAAQNLVAQLFKRYPHNRDRVCHSQRYRQCRALLADWDRLQSALDTVIRESVDRDVDMSARELHRALLTWIFVDDVRLGDARFAQFGDLPLDYLLQLLLSSNDKHPWVDFIDVNAMRTEITDHAKLFINRCHLEETAAMSSPNPPTRTVPALIEALRSQCSALPAPDIPLHPNLPQKVDVSVADCMNHQVLMHKFAPQLAALTDLGRRFVASRDAVGALDQAMIAVMPGLYTTQQTSLPIVLRCSAILSKCPRPNTITVIANTSQFVMSVDAQIAENRQKRGHELATAQGVFQDPAAVHIAMLEHISRAVASLDVEGELHARKVQETGLALFYHLVRSIGSGDLLFPAAHDAFQYCFSQLGSVCASLICECNRVCEQRFVAGRASEQTTLMAMVLGGSHLGHLLIAFFTPHCLQSSELMQLYAKLSIAVRSPSSASAALALMQRVDLIENGRFTPGQLSSLLPIAFENMVSVGGDGQEALFRLCADHFIHATFQHFPENFIHGLRLALQGCDTNSTPSFVFEEFVRRLNADPIRPVDESRATISAITALEACVVLSDQVRVSRREFGPRLFTVWKNYLARVAHLAHFFMHRAFSLTFDSQLPVSKMEYELGHCFEQVLAVFGPLLEPVGTGVAAWTIADSDVAVCVLSSFIALLEHLHSLYDTYLPPGRCNVEALVWQCYAQRLTVAQRGSGHVYQLLEEGLIRLPWHQFWPHLSDLHEMRRVVNDGASECAPFVTQMIVRIPWSELIAHQMQQPIDANRAFFSLFISIIARCCTRASNYNLCKASLPAMLESLLASPWYLISSDALRPDIAYMETAFTPAAVKDPDHVNIAFFALLRHVCAFTSNTAMPDAIAKRGMFLRLQLQLMLRNGDRQWATEFYGELIEQTDAIIATRGGEIEPDAAVVVRELCACWSRISDEKLGGWCATRSDLISLAIADALVKRLIEWLRVHHDSPIVLLVMKTVVEALNANQLPTALRVIEVAICSYFRGGGVREWKQVMQWIHLPEQESRKWLYTIPSSENGVTPHLLTMNALLEHVLPHASTMDERAWMLATLDYLTAVKIKYFTDETSLCLVIEKVIAILQRLFLQAPTDTSNHNALRRIIEWLNRAHSDERSSLFSMIGLAKRPSFSPRMRLICELTELYLIQQTLSGEQSPRLQPDTPVLNSRVQAVRDLSAQKAINVYASTMQRAMPFFSNVRLYNFGHCCKFFAVIVSELFSDEKSLHLFLSSGQ